MARNKVPFLVLFIHGRDVTADLHGARAASVELAAHGRIGGRRNVARKQDALHLFVRVGVGNGGERG